MNKIKAVYDLVRAIQRKQSRKGNLIVELLEGSDMVGSMGAEFDMNKETGRGKVSHKIETTLNGGSKHSGEAEFSLEGCHEHHHKIMGRMHAHTGNESVVIHKGHHKGCGHLSKLSFGLAVLDSLNVEEKADGGRSYVLDMKQPSDALMEMMKEMQGHDCCKGEQQEGTAKCCPEASGKEGCCMEAHGMRNFIHEMMKMEDHDGKAVIETDKECNPIWMKIDASGKSLGQASRAISAEMKLS